MLTILFFIAVFSSLTWLSYILLYINDQLSGAALSSLPAVQVALYAGLVVLPLWVVWQIFGFISQFYKTRNIDMRLQQLFAQMKKNQDYTDLVVRVMLDAEHEIKDGFVINKFDVFVADMNEILADIAQRCNAASSLQLEQLWSRVKNGERWTIAKALVEAAESHSNFAAYLAQKAQKDKVFRGTLLEFCSRYQNLYALLEKHDRDRTFITIVETGVMGKVYSILAPAAEGLEQLPPEKPAGENHEEEAAVYGVSPRILEMEAPEIEKKPLSLWGKIFSFKNRFFRGRADTAPRSGTDDEEFFAALQKSMSTPQETHKSISGGENMRDSVYLEPRFDLSAGDMADDTVSEESGSMPYLQPGETYERQPSAGGRAEASENETRHETGSFADIGHREADNAAAPQAETDSAGIRRVAPAAEDVPAKNGMLQKKAGDSADDFAYPFGGWTDENNYQK